MTTVFTGAGSTALWSEAANWDNNIPSPSNDAVLDGVAASGDKNSTIDIAALGALSLIGYTGTVISNIVTITVNGNFLQNTGTFLSISLNLDILGDFTTAVTVPDFQLISASNMSVSGNIDIADSSGTFDNANTFFTVGVGASTFDISNPNNDTRINDLRMTPSCTMNLLAVVYADTLTGPESGTSTITGAGIIINLDAWLNGNNIVCNADSDGGVEIVFNFSPIRAHDYGNFALSSTQTSVTISDFNSNDLTCFNLLVFESPQNNTINMVASGSFNAFINGTLKIGDTVVDTRGGIFTWGSSGILTVNDFQMNDIDGIQEAKWVGVGQGAGPVIINGSLTVGSLAEIDADPLTLEILRIGVDCIIDAAAIADFALTRVLLVGTGNVSNPTTTNAFINLEAASSTFTTTMNGDVRVDGLLSFNGGTFDKNNNTLYVKGPGVQFAGTVTFNNTGGGGSLRIIANAGDVSVTGISVDTPVRFTAEGSDLGFTLLGDCDFSLKPVIVNNDSDTFTGTLNLDAFEMICGDIRVSLSSNPTRHAIIILGTGTITSSGNISIETTGSSIDTGSGFITANDLDQLAGSYFGNGAATLAGDHLLALGATFDLGSGDMLTGGAFLPLGAVDMNFGSYFVIGDFDITGALSITYGNSQIIFFGGQALQTIDFGAASPHEVIFVRTGGIAAMVAAFIASGRMLQIATGNNIIEWLDGGAFGCTLIQTVGEGSFKTSNISSGVGTYTITVDDLGSVNRFSGWSNCDIIGQFIKVDLLTGSDDGGNDVTPPFGIDFGNFPFDPIDFPGLGKLRKLGLTPIFPNIYRAPHKWHAESADVLFFLVKNAIDEQVFNAIDQEVKT